MNFFTIATTDFTLPNLEDLKLSDIMIFGHLHLDINLLKANKNIFELMSVVSSK